MNYLENEIYRADIEAAISNVNGFDYFDNKRILVLGSTGLIGSFLVDCFLYSNSKWNMNIDIYAVSRKREHLKLRFAEGTDKLHFVEGDVISLEMAEDVDIIIHAASHAHPQAFRETPVETMLGNFLGTHRVMEIARKNPGCRVLFVSSGEVQEYVDHLTVRACYPVSKKASETLCLSYMQEYGIDVVMARPCHTFGANVTQSDNRATAQFIGKAVRNEDIVLNSLGTQVRSFAYVADCVSGLLTIAACGQKGYVYGVAADETCSVRQFAKQCADAAHTQVLISDANAIERAEASPIKEQIIDNTDLKGLGWKPLFTIEQGIRHSIIIQRQTREQ
ncbi:MAG: NAD-dependent epimerase/dehydratase family protein [Lachnospiraceae bacterium]|nr:NAD-dependent epimerase/dehydratase family protein [Lachnospiraceae bacterium]